MRYFHSAGLRAGLVALVVGVPAAASAQSFLQSLFGGGQSSPQPDRTIARPGAPAYATGPRPAMSQATPWTREIRRYSPVTPGDPRDAEGENAPQATTAGGKYRTLCVRTCDGYYFPIANSVSRTRFMRDAAQCRASCGEEARLFYLPSGSDNVSTMLDLAGRSYVRMPTAFKYRKSLTDGCGCRPMPWSAAEQQRHQRYAEEAARAEADAEAKRLVAEAADAVRTASTGKPAGAGTSKPLKPGERPASVAAVSTTVEAGVTVAHVAAASGNEAADGARQAHDVAATAVGTDVDDHKQTLRAERQRQAAAARGADRATAARRQQAVARAPVQQGGGNSWFSPSSSKYTWPGDPPRR